MKTEMLKFERIRNLRVDNDLTRQKVADYLHVKRNTYSQYEIGVLNYPVEVLIKLSPALQMFRMESRLAAWPEEVHMAPTPPSRAAIFSSTAMTVGLANRE